MEKTLRSWGFFVLPDGPQEDWSQPSCESPRFKNLRFLKISLFAFVLLGLTAIARFCFWLLIASCRSALRAARRNCFGHWQWDGETELFRALTGGALI